MDLTTDQDTLTNEYGSMCIPMVDSTTFVFTAHCANGFSITGAEPVEGETIERTDRRGT